MAIQTNFSLAPYITINMRLKITSGHSDSFHKTNRRDDLPPYITILLGWQFQPEINLLKTLMKTPSKWFGGQYIIYM